jgi:hypothetical protein
MSIGHGEYETPPSMLLTKMVLIVGSARKIFKTFFAMVFTTPGANQQGCGLNVLLMLAAVQGAVGCPQVNQAGCCSKTAGQGVFLACGSLVPGPAQSGTFAFRLGVSKLYAVATPLGGSLATKKPPTGPNAHPPFRLRAALKFLPDRWPATGHKLVKKTPEI